MLRASNRTRFAAVLIFSVVIAGCQDPVSAPQPQVATSALVESHSRTVYPSERLFMQLAMEVEEFGGYYLEPGGALVVYLTDPDAIDALTNALATTRIGESGLTQEGDIVIRQARYNFLQLQKWRDELTTPVLSTPGAVLLHIDEPRNRVTIGIASERFRQNFSRIITDLNIPEDAVHLEVTGPILADTHTLQDIVRPIAGGLQQVRMNSDGSVSGVCTIGFTAEWNGVRSWITNSHCTEVERSVVTGSQYFQNVPGPGTYIGREAHDPPGFPCYAGNNCRYSDAAVLELDSTVTYTFGGVTRTAGPIGLGWGDSGSIDIHHTSPTLSIVSASKEPVVGTRLDKIGRTTGWTSGFVKRTCVHFSRAAGHYLLCQHTADYWRQGGDSGSPVFARTQNTDEVDLYGIHWGANARAQEAIFSPMSGIQADLGPLKVTVSAKLQLAISGPKQVKQQQYCEWVADTSGGTMPYQYEWYRDGQFAGNGGIYQTSDTGVSDFLLEVFVTDSMSQSASALLHVTVDAQIGSLECEF